MGQLGDLSPGGSIAIGIAVGLLSTSVQSLGLTLQRKSHILEDEKDIELGRRPPHHRRRWQLGMLMFVVANLLGSTIQITTLPLPVLSTLQASGLVFNSICASLILGEPFTRWSLGGTVLVCAGAVLIALFGAFKEPAHNLDQLLHLLQRRPFVVWMICQALLVALVILAAKSLRLVSPRTLNTAQTRLLRGMAYGAVSGILSAHCLLLAKSAVELVVRTIVDRVNQFDRYQSWLILLGLLALALCQLYYLHRGLRLVSTSILYPFVFCIYNIVAILDGLIYFRQTSRLSVLHAVLIALGTLILLTGIFALSWGQLQDPDNLPPTTVVAQQSALTPGLGFVDDISESSPSSASASPCPSPTLVPSPPASPGPSRPLLLPPKRSHTLADLESSSHRPLRLPSAGAARLLDRHHHRRRSSAAALASLLGRRLPLATASNPTSPIATERTALLPQLAPPRRSATGGAGPMWQPRGGSGRGKKPAVAFSDAVGSDDRDGTEQRRIDDGSGGDGGGGSWGRRMLGRLIPSYARRESEGDGHVEDAPATAPLLPPFEREAAHD